jgi:hypothetical protein
MSPATSLISDLMSSPRLLNQLEKGFEESEVVVLMML